MRAELEALLALFFAEGALRGASAAEAFAVRCDRTTMTQADLDAGRVVAEVAFDAAVPVARIRVVIALAAADRGAGTRAVAEARA